MSIERPAHASLILQYSFRQFPMIPLVLCLKSKQEAQHGLGALLGLGLGRRVGSLDRGRAAGLEEQDLDGDGQGGVQDNDQDQKDLAGLVIRGAQHRPQVSQEESHRQTEPDAHEHVVEDLNRRPGDQGNGDPDQVGVAVERPTLQQIGGLGSKVTQGTKEQNRNTKSVAVDQTSGT